MVTVSQAKSALTEAYDAGAAEVWRQVEAGETPSLNAGDIIILLSRIAALNKARMGNPYATPRQKAHSSLRNSQSSNPRFLEELVEHRLEQTSALDLLTRRLQRQPTETELAAYARALIRMARHHETRFEGLGYCGLQAVQQWPELTSIERRLDWEVQED